MVIALRKMASLSLFTPNKKHVGNRSLEFPPLQENWSQSTDNSLTWMVITRQRMKNGAPFVIYTRKNKLLAWIAVRFRTSKG